MAVTYSIVDETGNLVDAFDDHDVAVAALAAMVKAEPTTADDLFLVSQNEDGEFVGETLYGSTLVAA